MLLGCNALHALVKIRMEGRRISGTAWCNVIAFWDKPRDQALTNLMCGTQTSCVVHKPHEWYTNLMCGTQTSCVQVLRPGRMCTSQDHCDVSLKKQPPFMKHYIIYPVGLGNSGIYPMLVCPLCCNVMSQTPWGFRHLWLQAQIK